MTFTQEQKAEIVKRLCDLCDMVGRAHADRLWAHDCFCGENTGTDDSMFQFNMQILDYIEGAIQEKVEGDFPGFAKYIVMGGWCEHTAHLDCYARSEEEALKAWDAAFPDLTRAGFSPEATCLATRPDMLKYWHYAGWRSYTGGYKYDLNPE